MNRTDRKPYGRCRNCPSPVTQTAGIYNSEGRLTCVLMLCDEHAERAAAANPSVVALTRLPSAERRAS